MSCNRKCECKKESDKKDQVTEFYKNLSCRRPQSEKKLTQEKEKKDQVTEFYKNL